MHVSLPHFFPMGISPAPKRPLWGEIGSSVPMACSFVDISSDTVKKGAQLVSLAMIVLVMIPIL